MKLIKEKSYTELEGTQVAEDLLDLIGRMIDFYSAIFVHRDNWCTKQEKLFLIACIIIGNKKLRYTSDEATEIFKNVFNLRRQSDVRGIMRRLEENNWILSDKETKQIKLLEFFKIDLNQQNVKFNIELKLEK